MTPVDRSTLVGHWVHSHEEDSGDEIVFRPAGYGFPPSRGRRALELRPDGKASRTDPGPTDKPESAPAGWELCDGDVLEVDGERLPIVSAEPDRLVLRRR
jgi:hypothetical protein